MNIIKKKKFKGKKIDVVDFETNLTGLRIKHEMIEQGNAVADLLGQLMCSSVSSIRIPY